MHVSSGYFADEQMTQDVSRLAPEQSTTLQAHSGFLNSARALDKAVSQRIQMYICENASNYSHVLFTGHSAGGAVASLLFLRYLAQERLCMKRIYIYQPESRYTDIKC